jgi:hypothetical protein
LATSVAAFAQPVAVTVHADRVAGEMRPIWNYFGYDEAGTTVTPAGRHLLEELNALSDEPIRIRVHHLLTSGDGTLALKWSSTNVYTEDAQGRPAYDWTRLDAIMDVLTQPGIEPFVQAGFMPQALSSQPEPYTPTLVKTGLPRDMVSGGAFHPPKDYAPAPRAPGCAGVNRVLRGALEWAGASSHENPGLAERGGLCPGSGRLRRRTGPAVRGLPRPGSVGLRPALSRRPGVPGVDGQLPRQPHPFG